MQDFLEEQIYLPKSGKIEKMIIMFHGFGSNGDDLISLAPFIAEHVQDAIFISPNGIEACEAGGFGYQWFSLENRDPEFLYNLIKSKEEIIFEYISKKLEEYKITSENLILLGFSQGSMLSLHLALHSENNIAGVVGFSGSLILPENNLVINKNFSACLIHGMYDDIVPFAKMAEAHKNLDKLGVSCSSHAIANLTHSIDKKALDHAISFILKLFAKT